MSGLNPIGEPLEELESLVSGISPIAPSVLPGTSTNKPSLYQTNGAPSNSEKLNLIEPAGQPPSELSLTETDAFIINKSSDKNRLHSLSAATATPSNTTTDSISKTDPLIGGSVAPLSEKADPLTNPGTLVKNNVSSGADKTNPAPDALNKNAATNSLSDAPKSNATLQITTALPDTNSTTNVTPIEFTGGTFKVLEVPGQESFVGIEFLSDGGLYRGELAVFSLEGMDKFGPGSPEFIKEAARRALSNSHEGYVVISDDSEGAKLSSYLPEGDFNSGEYKGVKTFAMKAGTEFGFMLVPNGTVQFACDNPSFGGDKQPLFSMVTASPDDAFSVGQIADITGDGSTFAIEDMGVVAAADGDYNDVIFRVTNVKTSNTASIGAVINPRLDWRPTAWGKNLIDVATSKPETAGSIAANPINTEQQKTETVAGELSSKAPATETKVGGSDKSETAKKETTVAGIEKSETLAIDTTVGAGENPASETTETTVAGVGKSETTATETTAIDVGYPTPKTATTVTEAVGSEPSKTEITASNKVNSEPITTGTTVTESVDLSTAKTGTTVTESVGSEPSKTEITVAEGVGSEPSNAETTAASAAGSERSKPESSVADVGGFETPTAETIASDAGLPELAKTETISSENAVEETELPVSSVDLTSEEIELPIGSIDRLNALIETTQTEPESVSLPAATAATETAVASNPLAATETPSDAAVALLPTETDTESEAISNTLLPAETDTESETISNTLLTAGADTESIATLNTLSAEETNNPDTEPNASTSNSSTTATGTEELTGDTEALPDFESSSSSQQNLTNLSIAPATTTPSGIFTVGETGEIKIDYSFDGGYYSGELAIFSLAGMEAFTPGTPEFATEALRRALTNSSEGHVVIRDSIESAKFSGAMPSESDFGAGTYQGVKTFNMTPGDTFGVLLVPSGGLQLAYQHPWLGDIFPEHRPLISIPPANPNNTSYLLQIADITGNGNAFALEDMPAANSDGDFNDIIFKISGGSGSAPSLDTLINPNREWRNTTLGQQILSDLNNSNSGNNPPVVSPTSVRTYTELEAKIPLGNLAVDAEGDPITISVLNPVNGTVLFDPLTKAASFKPAPGFSGIASFDFLASDGFGSSTPATVTVNVSDVPLLNLDFVKRNPRLNAGETEELVVLGDFADREDVVLPDSYLTYTSFNPEVATIDAAGNVTGLVNGTSILKASRNNLQAVTALRVGELPAPTNDAEFNAALAEIYGLNVYPKAVTMTAGMARSLLVGIDNISQSPDLKFGAAGTRYFPGNSNLLQVNSDGVITATEEGVTNVTVIHGAAEQVVPVRVSVPAASGAILGVNGGAVTGSDGSILMLPPGALAEDTAISFTALNSSNLSLPLPEGLQFAGGFNLDVGDRQLKLPAQLAIPAPVGLSPGTEVLFLRKGSLPDANNVESPTWLIQESGVVDANGTIRTNSPPLSGFLDSGEYKMMVWPALGLVGAPTLQGLLNNATVDASLATTKALNLSTNVGLQNTFLAANAGLIGIAAVTGAQFAATILVLAYLAKYLQSGLQVIAIPPVGLPVVTPAGVELNPDGIPSVTATLNIPTLFPADPSAPPVLQSAEFKLENGSPTVVLTGSNFLNNSGDFGSEFEDLTVSFRVGDKTYPGVLIPESSTDLGENRYKVTVKIPLAVSAGDADIVVSRKQKKRLGHGAADYEIVELESEENIRLTPTCLEWGLIAERSSDRINVISLRNAASTVETQDRENLAVALNIPLGDPNIPSEWPDSIAATNNATRAYVTMRNTGRVSVVDLMALREIDTNPQTATVDAIALPNGARPQAIAIDKRDNYAYIADRDRPNIYVLDINPNSATYHTVVETINVTSPLGLSQLAISSDGRRLFATGSDNSEQTPNRRIYAINIDPADKPSSGGANTRLWHQQIGAITTLSETEGIAATADPTKMVFTNGLATIRTINNGEEIRLQDDGKGFGVLEIKSDDPLNFIAEPSYIPLSLGSATDYFDVNEAVAVTITKDERYAFVAGRNSLGSTDANTREGGNIGIIKDPLGSNPRLVAATRPIPGSLTNNLALSSDGKYLIASYPTLNLGGSAYIFDVEEMIKAVENPGNYKLDARDRGVGTWGFQASSQRDATVADLARVPVDDINPLVSIAADFEITGGNWINNFAFSVPEGTNRAPIGIGGNPKGLAIASVRNWLELKGPIGDSKNDSNPLTPTFKWDLKGEDEFCGLPGFNPDTDVSSVNLYVSVFPEGSGLLPGDRWSGLENPTAGQDYNPNRVLTARWRDGMWTWNGVSQAGSPEEFTLPNNRMLTAGQKYHWAVEVVTNQGEKTTEKGDFKTLLPGPIAGANTFSSVTVLTRGLEAQPNLIDRQFEQMASHLTKENGLVMYYEADTGRWYWQDGNAKNYQIPSQNFGQPLVLIPNLTMTPYQTGFNSGFAEAAADSLFASLVSLNQQLDSNALFNSPAHFIGTGQGAVINSEIIQRLGTFFPKNPQRPDDPNNLKFPDLQMTTVDPHDFNQPSLKRNLRSLNDPQVTAWSNVTFADNYYQEVAEGSGERTETRNGREIENADRNVSLTDWAGFESDDLFGSPHRQAVAWYAGTANLNASELPSSESKSPTEKIYRRLGDLETVDRTPNSNKTWYSPDYRGYPYLHGSQNAPWEGIGTGWFHSVLGGGQQRRPDALLGARTPVSFDNTAEARMRGDFAVPTLFNGNFDAVTHRFSGQNIPGWSNYNGPQNVTQNVSQKHLVEWSEIGSLSNDYRTGVGYDPARPNYALLLSGDGQREVTHNRFVVPEWGALRFNLHVPNPNGGTVAVSIAGDAPGYETYQTIGNIDLRVADGRVNPGALPEIAYPLGYADTDTNRIGYGNIGFETFHVDVPEVLRGKSAKLKFELEGNNTVYLDDVFFKSAHLKLGNPTFARPSENTHRENYLIEKPQYSLSYNDAIKGPNWVSWQLNKSWLGNTPRPGVGNAPSGYPPTGFPDGTYPAATVDYPWLGDSALPSSWVRTEGPDYRVNQRGMEKGHMTPVADRDRTTKDVYSTFLTSNMLPQHGNGNNRGAWQNFERDIRTSVENSSVARDYYIIAGGYGYDPTRAIGNAVSVGADGRTVLDSDGTWTVNPKGILIPEFTWKIVAPLVAGQSIDDITANTEVVAIMIPNRDRLVTPRDFPLPGETNRTITNWNEWRDWRVSIDYLEDLTGYDFLSELPESIQGEIESRDDGLLPS